MKGILVSLAFIILSTITSVAQESAELSTYKKSIQIGINFSGGVSYHATTTDFTSPNYTFSDFEKPYFYEVDKPAFGFNTGANILYNFSKHFAVEAGLQYSRKSYASTTGTHLTFGDMIDPRYGFVYETQDNSTWPSDNRYDFHYLDIPLRIIYNCGEKKLSFRSSFGISANILLKGTAHAFYGANREEKRKIQDLNPVGISSFVSAGIKYKLNDHFSLAAEPTFNFSLTQAGKSTMQIYLWNAGLNFSCYYILR